MQFFTVQGPRWCASCLPCYLDVPPEVTTGRVVVVVGGRVVVVVGVVDVGVVVGVVGVVGVVVVGVVVAGVDEIGAGSGTFGLADDPGCSFATMTPMHAVAPPARTIVVVVRRRTRARARSRAIGERLSRVRLTVIHQGIVPGSAHGR